MSLAGCLSLPFTGCCPMPYFAAMRLRGASEGVSLPFAFHVPLPDTLPILPCGAGGFAGAYSRRKAGYGCTSHMPAARLGAAWCLVLGKGKPRPEPGLFGDDP